MARNVVGAPVRGDDFFDREELIDLVWDRIEAGNVLLAAPRRFGKTSVMYRLMDRPRPGWTVLHVDAESIREPVNFIIALLDAATADERMRRALIGFWTSACGWAGGIFEDIEVTSPWDVGLKIKLKQEIGPDWEEKGGALLGALRHTEDKLLLIIDELPVMLSLFADNGISDADTRAFLYWFRKLRVDPQVGLADCRFIVGGSIGIENHLSQLGVQDSFNDFERVHVGELAGDMTGRFLDELLRDRGIQLSAAAKHKALDLIGTPIPYFIQLFVAQMANASANGESRLGPTALEQLYEHQVLGAQCKTYFQHYYDRLRRYTKAQEKAAKSLLRQLALAFPSAIQTSQLWAAYQREIAEGATREGFNRLISDLENDFYIRVVSEDAGYAFGSKILCDWWKRYYAF